MTKDQIHTLKMALFLAGYYVDENKDEDDEQWQIDNERVILAREILQQIEEEVTE